MPRIRIARATLVAGCSAGIDVRFVGLDALDHAAVRALIETQAPDALVQCASMHSPWLLHARCDPTARRLRAAGFASELSAQLPIARNVFSASYAVGYDGSMINCSYPDVVNPVLAAAGFAPSFGIGNAGMVHLLAETALRARGLHGRLRTLAHHAHVTMTATGRFPLNEDIGLAPRFALDARALSPREVFLEPVGSDRNLNELTAAHAVAMLRAHLGLTPPLRTAAPGVLGRAGGWPVTVAAGAVEFDPPPGTTEADLQGFNTAAARLDGIEAIDADGTVRFTAALQDALGPDLVALAEPLSADQALVRYAQLRAVLALGDMSVDAA